MLKIVEQKISKALSQLDRHDSRHTNLFFAYFDRQEQAEDRYPLSFDADAT